VCASAYTRWIDQNGIERYGCEIIAEQVDFLAKAKGNSANSDHPEAALEVAPPSADRLALSPGSGFPSWGLREFIVAFAPS